MSLLKTKISLGIRPVLSESSLSAFRNFGSWTIKSALSEDNDQTKLSLRWAHRSFCLLCRAPAVWVRVNGLTSSGRHYSPAMHICLNEA